MSKRKPSNAPLTKGAALIHAREILGPAATVQRTPTECKVLAPGVALYGTDFEHILKQAQQEPQAAAWQNYKDGRRQAFKEAVDSLRKTIREILGGKEIKHFTRAEHKFVRGGLGNLV